MADEQSKWKLDLDHKDFIKNAGESLGSIQRIGDSKNLVGLLSSFAKANVALSLIGAAALALKTTLDTVFEAENIKAINSQFEILSKNAGLVGPSLQAGLEKASGGLIDNTELLQIANRSIVEMGKSAEKLPEIMELARKATAVMGGDLKTNFENLSHGIALGNAKMLKQMGIVIDTDKAYQKLAKSLGVSVGELSEAGKKQAILNEALEKGQKAFRGVDDDVKKATNSFQKLTVFLGDLYERAVLAFDKAFGPTTNSMIQSTLTTLKTWFGTDIDKAEVKVNSLTKHIELLNHNIETQDGALQRTAIAMKEKYTKELEIAKQKLAELRGETENLKVDFRKEKVGPESDAQKTDLIDKEKSKEQQRRFEQDLLALKKERLDAEAQNQKELGENEINLKTEIGERKKILDEEYDLKRRELAEKYKNDENQQRELQFELEAAHREKLLEIDRSYNERKLEILKKATDQSKTASDGMSNAFKEGIEKNRQDLNNWGSTGRLVFNSFAKHSKQALLDFGAGTKSAGDAMKGFLFGAIADTAEAKGMELLLSSLWPPNPLGLAAGGGLVALAGMLRAQAGSSAGGGLSGAGGAGGGGAATSGALEAERPGEAEIQQKKAVTVQVMGSYFETEQTRTRLVEMIREESDATDFQFKQIGQT